MAVATEGWPPRWLTPVPEADVKRGDGEGCVDFAETVCRVDKDSVAARAGTLLQMRFWQRRLLGHLLARRPDGRLRHREALIGIGRKNGKALDVDTPLLTSRGWSTMGAVQPGDQVFTGAGRATPVVAVSEVMTDRTCFEVRFADGARLIADEQHLWTVRDRQQKLRVRTVTTAELASGVHFSKRGDRRWSVVVPGPVSLPERAVALDPYLLGAWLGDGTAKTGAITSADEGVHARFYAEFERGASQRRGQAVTQTYLGLQRKLRLLGLLRNKHVPVDYLLGSTDQRVELLRGLMDTDGSVVRGPNTPRVEFCNTSRVLAEAVLFLSRSLGWKATIAESDATLNGVVVGRRWRVTWTAYREFSPFALARKTDLLAMTPESPTRASTNAVVSVVPVPSRPVRCIRIADPQGVFLAGESLTPTHNSGLGAALGLEGLVLGPVGGEVYSCAAEKEQAKIVFNTARRMVMADPDLSEILKVYRDVIEFSKTGSIYRALSAEAYSKEGLNPHRVIFDEVHAQPTRELWDVMALAMGARVEPLMIGITTAGVRTDSTGQDSLCYKMYQYGCRVVSGEIEDPTFFMAWWEPLNPEADHRDPETWRAANPGLGDLVSVEDMASKLLRTPENEYRIKRCNQWVAQQQAWFQAGQWESLKEDRPVPDGAEVVLSFDGSFSGDSTGLTVHDIEDCHIDVVDCWEKPPNEDGWKVSPDEVETILRQAFIRWRVRHCVYDPRLWQQMFERLAAEGYPVEPMPQGQAMIQAAQRFYEGAKDRKFTHSGDERLARHVRNAVIKATPQGWRVQKETPLSPRKIDLAACAIQGHAFAAAVVPSNQLDGRLFGSSEDDE